MIRVMTLEFYLVLKEADLTDELADTVFEAGFDDCSLTMRNGHAATWVTDRHGDLTELMREAVAQANRGGLSVSHVEIENEVFA